MNIVLNSLVIGYFILEHAHSVFFYFSPLEIKVIYCVIDKMVVI